jgi:hypothetical protein
MALVRDFRRQTGDGALARRWATSPAAFDEAVTYFAAAGAGNNAAGEEVAAAAGDKVRGVVQSDAVRDLSEGVHLATQPLPDLVASLVRLSGGAYGEDSLCHGHLKLLADRLSQQRRSVVDKALAGESGGSDGRAEDATAPPPAPPAAASGGSPLFSVADCVAVAAAGARTAGLMAVAFEVAAAALECMGPADHDAAAAVTLCCELLLRSADRLPNAGTAVQWCFLLATLARAHSCADVAHDVAFWKAVGQHIGPTIAAARTARDGGNQSSRAVYNLFRVGLPHDVQLVLIRPVLRAIVSNARAIFPDGADHGHLASPALGLPALALAYVRPCGSLVHLLKYLHRVGFSTMTYFYNLPLARPTAHHDCHNASHAPVHARPCSDTKECCGRKSTRQWQARCTSARWQCKRVHTGKCPSSSH